MGIDGNSLTPLSRLRLIQASNLLVALMAGTAVIFKLYSLGFHNPPLPTLFVTCLALANFIDLRRSHNLDRSASVLIVLFIFGLVFAAGANSGGFDGPVVGIAPVAPVIATLMINARAGLYAFLLCCCVLLVLAVLQLQGLLSPNPNPEDALIAARFLAILLTTAICTAVVWGFATLSSELIDENRNQANTDHLTGLSNRRAIECNLLIETSRSGRAGSWLSLLMIDVDHFKRYNDSKGHQAGDDCLVAIAKVISSCAARGSDTVGRFGGEEFMVLLVDTDEEGAKVVAEKIRRSILATKLFYDDKEQDIVSVTVGIAAARGSEMNRVEDFIKMADEALYLGKTTGRNKVVCQLLEPDAEKLNTGSNGAKGQAVSLI